MSSNETLILISLFLIGVIILIIILIYSFKNFTNNEKLAKKMRAEANDERNIAIRNKATSYMWVVSLLSLCAILVVSAVQEIFVISLIAMISILIHLFGYVIIQLFLNKKM